MSKKMIAGFFLIAIQLAVLVYYRMSPERFFCWAPFDQQTVYALSVTVDGKAFSQREISDRYHFQTQRYWINDSITWEYVESRYVGNVQSIIVQYESTYGKNENAMVEMNYTINGKPQPKWTWPPTE